MNPISATDPFIVAEAAMLPRWEAAIGWMYLDIKGNVTAGLGIELPTLAEALNLSFQVDNSPATPDQIVADFNRVKAMPFGQKYAAGYYKEDSSPLLSPPDIVRIATGELVQMAQELQKAVPNFHTLPDPAKTALLDMEWNMGLRGLEGFKHMLAAAEEDPPDFTLAADDCTREAGVQSFAARNAWTRSLFEAASSVG